jgi:hypothetical protein
MFTDKVAKKRFAELQRQYGFSTCFETGTHTGMGTLRASWYCNIVTIEVNPDYQMQAIQNWMERKKFLTSFWPQIVLTGEMFSITSILGNSPDVLREELKKDWHHPLCFFLDAHWGEYWPLRDELQVIAQAKLPVPPVIIIHDAKVPGTDFAFDSYGGHDLDYEYVKDLLNEINPDYQIAYNDESFDIHRGILYALP